MNPTLPKIKSYVFVLKLIVLGAFSVAGFFLAATGQGFTSVLGTVLLGAMFAHAVELQHQCLHYTAFQSRSLNRVVGILLGLPMLTSFHAYRRSHLDHHRNLGTPGDTPFFSYRFIESGSLGALLYDLLGISHLKTSLSSIFGQNDSRLIVVSNSNEPSNISERFDYGLMGFMIACACLYTMGFGSVLILKTWLLPLLFVAQPIHFLIELPEHIGCATDSTDSFQNTRTIIGSRFSRWFTNSNNLHVEHHLAPALSMDQLGDLFQSNRGKHKYLTFTYIQFYWSLFQMFRPASLVVATDNSARRPA